MCEWPTGRVGRIGGAPSFDSKDVGSKPIHANHWIFAFDKYMCAITRA